MHFWAILPILGKNAPPHLKIPNENPGQNALSMKIFQDGCVFEPGDFLIRCSRSPDKIWKIWKCGKDGYAVGNI